MSTTSSTPMPATGSLQLIEAVTERLDGAPVGERRRWSDEFKENRPFPSMEMRMVDLRSRSVQAKDVN